jgi:hypothetical protein
VDNDNNRVLQFNSIPTSHGASADVVLGQAVLTSRAVSFGAMVYSTASANGMFDPYGVWGISSGSKLFISDGDNHRVLVFNDPGTSVAPSSSPSNLSGLALGVSSISWTWTALTTSYHRLDASSGGAISPALAANTTWFIETNLSTNTAYTRVVLAAPTTNFVLTSTSTASTKYTLTTDPTDLVASTVSLSSVVLGWSANTNPSTATRYGVQQSTSSNFTSTALSTPVAYSDALTLTSTTISNLLPGTTVAFRVLAFNGDGVQSLGFSGFSVVQTSVPVAYTNNVSLSVVSSVTSASPVARDSRTSVAIPANTALPNSSVSGLVAITTNPAQTPLVVSTDVLSTANSAVVSGQYLVTGSEREFVFYDQGSRRQTGNFGALINLYLPYADTNSDGYIDSNTKIPESKLKVHKLNETTQKWEEVAGTVVDTEANLCYAQVRSFSVYALIAPLAASDLSQVRVYPTPWLRGSGGKFDATTLTFDNLTNQAKVQVFTILGELVFERDTTGTDGKLNWDGKNQKGETVASGVYLWRATNSAGQEKQGRLAIER